MKILRSEESKAAARKLLTDFLKKRRAALKPADVGLPSGSRLRRTPGLRRPEVAQLAGISTEWYTLFEMGRDRAMSQRVIEPISRALRLTEAEREYVSDLVRAELRPQPTLEIAPALCRLLEDDEKVVVVVDRWLTAVRWNAAAAALLSLDAADERSTNLLWRFQQAYALKPCPELESQGRFFIGIFRRALGRDPLNREANRIVASLRSYPTFRELWERHEVHSLDEESRVLRHPFRPFNSALDEIRYFTIGLPIPASAGGHVRITVPADDAGRSLLRQVTSAQTLLSA